jgi:hypothetical protein
MKYSTIAIALRQQKMELGTYSTCTANQLSAHVKFMQT